MIHQELNETVTIHDRDFDVHLVHRDWNPLEGFEDVAPKEPFWVAESEIEGHKVVAHGTSKEDAMVSIIYNLGFRHGALAVTHYREIVKSNEQQGTQDIPGD